MNVGSAVWTRRLFKDNQVRLQLFALAYNLGNFLRRLALPRSVKHWSLATLREKLIKIGAKSFGMRSTSRSRWPKWQCRASCSQRSLTKSSNSVSRRGQVQRLVRPSYGHGEGPEPLRPAKPFKLFQDRNHPIDTS